MFKHDRELKTHLTNMNLDIRQTKNGRWYDQKVTPDIMAVICETIVELRKQSGILFSSTDIRTSKFFAQCMEQNFGKPSPSNPGAKREYDKVSLQPLNVLEASGIITTKSAQRPKQFQIRKGFSCVLEDMAGNELVTAEFLNLYITESLRQSGLWEDFECFFDNQDQQSFSRLKSAYIDFMHEHTAIKKAFEPKRIFSKVLNIPAYFLRKQGARGGKMSAVPIALIDIRYNQINFRDVKKLKNVPRQQQSGPIKFNSDGATPITRRVQRIIKDVKEFHRNTSEIQDEFSSTDPNSSRPVEGHHIFPKSQYPKLADWRENIIVLTQTQHQGQAHGGYGQSVSYPYQYLCLQKKLEAIEKCAQDPNCNFYSFSAFKKMLHHVGIITKKVHVQTLNFDGVRREMASYYYRRP